MEWTDFHGIVALGGLMLGFFGALVLHRFRLRALVVHQSKALKHTQHQANLIGQESHQACALKSSQLLSSFKTNHIRQQQRMTTATTRIKKHDKTLNHRAHQFYLQRTGLATLQSQIARLLTQLNALKKEVSAKQLHCETMLHRQAALTAKEIQTKLVQHAISRETKRLHTKSKQRVAHITQTVQRHGRRVLATAIDRYAGLNHLERTQHTVMFAKRETFNALTHAHDSSDHSAGQAPLLDALNCPYDINPSALAITVVGDDAWAKEIGSRILRQLAKRNIIDPQAILEIAKRVTFEVDREVTNAAKKATGMLAIDPPHPEIATLLGKLKFRLSASQNQWAHSIEVAYLAGIMAHELGCDVTLAQRGGLLHDIGKAMSHDHEGGHATLGAALARRCGEDEIVANAIGAHHHDEPPLGIIAHIVIAADALSGARPGARRENTAQYMLRIEHIKRIAYSFEGVERVDIMHAGREVRVTVGCDELHATSQKKGTTRNTPFHDALHPLAKNIAHRLDQEVNHPGPIRVSVIQESRSIALAR